MIWDERLEENLRNHDAYRGGRSEGIDIGKEQTKKEMIISMYNKNISLDLISEIVKLPVEDVKKIIKDNKEEWTN